MAVLDASCCMAPGLWPVPVARHAGPGGSGARHKNWKPGIERTTVVRAARHPGHRTRHWERIRSIEKTVRISALLAETPVRRIARGVGGGCAPSRKNTGNSLMMKEKCSFVAALRLLP